MIIVITMLVCVNFVRLVIMLFYNYVVVCMCYFSLQYKLKTNSYFYIMTQKRKTYDAAFKRQAVELSKGRKNMSELARELGIQPHLLYNWRREFKEFGEGSFPGN